MDKILLWFGLVTVKRAAYICGEIAAFDSESVARHAYEDFKVAPDKDAPEKWRKHAVKSFVQCAKATSGFRLEHRRVNQYPDGRYHL